MEILRQCPKTLKQHHFAELKASLISHEIIELNFKSISGNDAYDYLTYGVERNQRLSGGRLPTSILKRYEHIVDGAWHCAGINLLDYSRSEWGCVKPDKPKKSGNNVIKYEHPIYVPTSIFALDVPAEFWITKTQEYFLPTNGETNFWQWVINNGRIPIVITEGAKKAGCLLSQGLIAVALPGINNAFEKDSDELKPELKKLCTVGREIIFCFDQDSKWLSRINVSKAIKKTGKSFEALDCQVSVIVWESQDGKGIDDFIVKVGLEKFNQAYEERLGLEDYLEQYNCVKKLDKAKFMQFLSTTYKNRLAFNELDMRVELDGKPLELSGELCFNLLEEYNLDVTENCLINGFLYAARSNSYHPVQRYLQACLKTDSIPIDNLATRYLGIKDDDPLAIHYNTWLKKWLIAAVARIFEPGCSVHYALILQGRTHGIGKSSFFRTLGGKWCDSSANANIESTKTMMVFHKCWIQEWDEFDKVSTKTEANKLKSFITNATDCFVRPYGRDAIDYPRRFVIAGSVNKSDFLMDETGNRRILVIPIPEGHRVLNDLVKEEVDQIWSGAVKAYILGKEKNENAWVLTPEEEGIVNEVSKKYMVSDEWESMIADFIEAQETVTVRWIMEKLLMLEPKDFDAKTQKRITRILTSLGWINLGEQRDKLTGRKQRIWQAPMSTVLKM